ncbi:uncharacterized protein [Branchiostoma lanceolatum]|uniref:uncharacterized protein n=1 Tax=Branchiostoma lanceolatum TaxID=7740 RepID=UPI003455FB27
MADNTSSGNPTERSQNENMALMLTRVLNQVTEQGKQLEDQGKLLRELQDGRRHEPAAGDHHEDCSGQSRKKRRKSKSTSRVPDKCRDDTRKIYKALLQGENDFAGFNLNETVNSPANQRVMQSLRMEVVRDTGGEDKCPYTPKEVRDAAARYFRSLKDDKVRGDKGRLVEHRRKMRKAQRLEKKMNRRTKALNTCDTDSWEERNLIRAAEILDKRYMSSESSGDEVRDPPRLTVRRLSWESKSLRKLKKDLDKVCPPKASSTCRERSDELSDRPVPDGAPTWAIKSVTRRLEDPDSSFDSGPTDDNNS